MLGDTTMKNEWCDITGKTSTIDEVISKIQNGHEVHVGSDSQLVSGMWRVATVICIYNPGKGGIYFFSKRTEKKDIFRSLEERLLSEVAESLETADAIRALKEIKVCVHADVNSDASARSQKTMNRVISYVNAMGYECLVKPKAWASTTIADKHTR